MKKGTRLAAMVLIVLGVVSLAYGGFTYVEDTHDASIGPVEISLQDKERVNIPAWAGALCLLGGIGLAAWKW